MDPFVRSALLGTAASPGATTGTPVDPLVGETVPERRLLLAAGAWAVYLQAGYEPVRSGRLPEPAAEETLPACPPAVAAILRDLLGGEHRVLLDEACSRMASAGLRLPPDLLPAALAVPEAHRPAVRQVLGERGRWLAQLNPAWSWVRSRQPDAPDAPTAPEALPPDAGTVWEEGSLDDRVALLRRVRAVDPALARTWLVPVLPKEKAEPRAELVAALETGLGADDEELLEKVLDDRSLQVRAAAGLLLARLPASAYAGRMRGRADAMITAEEPKAGVWGRMVSLVGGGWKLCIDPPEEVDRSWERDGVPPNPPTGIGKRAFRLAEVLARVPPAHWVERLGRGPAELPAAAGDTDWGGAAAEGWARAALHFGDAEWAAPLWDLGHGKSLPELRGLLPRLLAAMPAAEREPRVGKLLADPPAGPLLQSYLRQLPVPWSPAFAGTYLEEARRAAADVARGGRQMPQDPWLVTFHLAATGLPPERFGEVLAPWPVDREGEAPSWHQGAWRTALGTLRDLIRIRQTLHKEIVP